MPSCDNLYCKYTYDHSTDWKFLQVCLFSSCSKVFFSQLQDVPCRSRTLSSYNSLSPQGIDNGMSQIARTSTCDQSFIWNYPIDITFKSSNPHGWPKLVVSAYTLNFWGTDVVQGYGWVHLPTTPGRYESLVIFALLFCWINLSLFDCWASLCFVLSNLVEPVMFVMFASTPLALPRSARKSPLSSRASTPSISTQNLWHKVEAVKVSAMFLISFFLSSASHAACVDLKWCSVTRVRSSGVVKIVFNCMVKNLTTFGYSVDDKAVAVASHVPTVFGASASGASSLAGGSSSSSSSLSSAEVRKLKWTEQACIVIGWSVHLKERELILRPVAKQFCTAHGSNMQHSTYCSTALTLTFTNPVLTELLKAFSCKQKP